MAPTQHHADSTIAYEWFTYVPPALAKEPASIWVSGLHGNLVTDRYAEIVDETRDMLERFAVLAQADRLRTPLLVPVLPRPFTPGRQSSVYTVALSRAVFLDQTPLFCRRPDLILNRMIDRFAGELRGRGYTIGDRILIDGFSAGGMFAQRYALLHPARVQALAAGQSGGALTLPETAYDGTALEWPTGVHDYATLTGAPFDRAAYRRIPQLVFIGDQDTSNSSLSEPGEVWSSNRQIAFMRETFGSSDPVRLANQVAYLRQLGYHNITFQRRAGVGHTERPFTDDVLGFLGAHI